MRNTGEQTGFVEAEDEGEQGQLKPGFEALVFLQLLKQLFFVVTTGAVQRCETTGAGKDFRSSASLSLIWEGRRKLSTSCSQHVKQSKGCWAPPLNSHLLPYRLFLSLIRDPTGTPDEGVRVVKDSLWEMTLRAGELYVPDKDLGRAAAWPSQAAGI